MHKSYKPTADIYSDFALPVAKQTNHSVWNLAEQFVIGNTQVSNIFKQKRDIENKRKNMPTYSVTTQNYCMLTVAMFK